jgi:hypothetical protein
MAVSAVPEGKPMRGLVPLEIAAVVAIAVAPWPTALPIALPLFIVASTSVWLRRRSWAEVVTFDRTHALIGAGVGVVALIVALLVGDPLASALTESSVQWSTDPIVRGNTAALGATIMITIVSSLCLELVLRGWIVERVLELSGDSVTAPMLAVLVGALAEALITPGMLATRIGAAMFAIGIGILYCAGKRNVLAPILARVTFGVGAVVLQALQVIG